MATATLNDNVIFAVGTTGQDANGWRLYDAESGGNELWRDDLANDPAALQQNQFYRIASGEFVITQPIGTDGATEEFAKRELRGALGPETWAELRQITRDGGGTVLTDVAVTGRVSVPIARWNIA